jgi:hypothetical protein
VKVYLALFIASARDCPVGTVLGAAPTLCFLDSIVNFRMCLPSRVQTASVCDPW